MESYTAINHQVFRNDAKVFCVCQSHDDALLAAAALNNFQAAQLPAVADSEPRGAGLKDVIAWLRWWRAH